MLLSGVSSDSVKQELHSVLTVQRSTDTAVVQLSDGVN